MLHSPGCLHSNTSADAFSSYYPSICTTIVHHAHTLAASASYPDCVGRSLGTRLLLPQPRTQTAWDAAWVRGYCCLSLIPRLCGTRPGYEAIAASASYPDCMGCGLGTRLLLPQPHTQTAWDAAWVWGYCCLSLAPTVNSTTELCSLVTGAIGVDILD